MCDGGIAWTGPATTAKESSDTCVMSRKERSCATGSAAASAAPVASGRHTRVPRARAT